MCGIVGFVSKNSSFLHKPFQQSLDSAIQLQNHRGPDRQAFYIDDNNNVGLAHARLSIQDLSDAGNQPMLSSDERYTIVYNGEIYNFIELRNELIDLGFSFYGYSDTEVLLAHITHHGINKTLEKLIGMYAFALYDRQERSITLCRDRIGEKPLYYLCNEQGLFFSSELSSIRKNVNTDFMICGDALSLYFKHQYIPAPYSIYRNTKKLVAGEVVTFDIDSLESTTGKYWSVKSTYENIHPICTLASKKELKSLLIDSIQKQLIADVDVGILLSGGVDSSLIAAISKKELGKNVETFTVGFSNLKYDESHSAKTIADYLGLKSHVEIIQDKDILELVKKIPFVYSEPFADTSLLPTILISKIAHNSVSVCLTGDGGDELFGGYTRYNMADLIYRHTSWIPENIRRISGGIANDLYSSHLSKCMSNKPREALYKFSKIISYSDELGLYENIISPFRSEIDNILKVKSDISIFDTLDLKTDGINFQELMMQIDKVTYLPENNLTKIDRASMYSSVEVRAPLLDYRIVSLSSRIQSNQKFSKSRGKLILRSLQHDYLPENIIENKKRGFTVPVGEWLKGPLKSWAEELLDSHNATIQEFINMDELKLMYKSHCNGDRDWNNILWTAFTFINWCHCYET